MQKMNLTETKSQWLHWTEEDMEFLHPLHVTLAPLVSPSVTWWAECFLLQGDPQWRIPSENISWCRAPRAPSLYPPLYVISCPAGVPSEVEGSSERDFARLDQDSVLVYPEVLGPSPAALKAFVFCGGRMAALKPVIRHQLRLCEASGLCYMGSCGSSGMSHEGIQGLQGNPGQCLRTLLVR